MSLPGRPGIPGIPGVQKYKTNGEFPELYYPLRLTKSRQTRSVPHRSKGRRMDEVLTTVKNDNLQSDNLGNQGREVGSHGWRICETTEPGGSDDLDGRSCEIEAHQGNVVPHYVKSYKSKSPVSHRPRIFGKLIRECKGSQKHAATKRKKIRECLLHVEPMSQLSVPHFFSTRTELYSMVAHVTLLMPSALREATRTTSSCMSNLPFI